jgi:hypothetical protein
MFEHDLFRKPLHTPAQVRGRLFRDHALDQGSDQPQELLLLRSLSWCGEKGPEFNIGDLSAGRDIRLMPYEQPARIGIAGQ